MEERAKELKKYEVPLSPVLQAMEDLAEGKGDQRQAYEQHKALNTYFKDGKKDRD
jgi:hypothetical protein